MSPLTTTWQLPNGVTIPQVGFGTWQIPAGQVAEEAVSAALAAGYRHIDTAWQYRNEKSVGAAVRKSGLARENVFVTSKLPAAAKSYDAAMTAFNESMANLDLGYIDLYLIHAPWPWAELGADYRVQNREVWRAMEDIYQSGKVRAIGISNFNVRDLNDITAHATIKPMALQLQYYIGFTEDAIVQAAREAGMLIEGFSPLATGFLLHNQAVQAIATARQVTVAQVALRYCLQKKVLPLPKAIAPAHIKANTQLDFALSATDMAALDALQDTAPGEDYNLYD